MRITVPSVLVLLCATPLAQAQVVGERIRITDATGSEYVGTVQDVDQDELTLVLEDDRLHRIAFVDMMSLETSLGIKRNVRAGALMGVGVGALAGVLTSTLFSGFCDPSEKDCKDAVSGLGVLTAVVVAVPGALVGAGLGALMSGEKWSVLPLPGAAHLEPIIRMPAAGSPVFGARLTF